MKKLLCIFIFIFASASFAMQIEVIERNDSGSARKIRISGEIKPGDNERLVDFIQTNQRDAYTGIIYLSSKGGDVREAMKLAQTLRELYKLVAVDDVCASSCLLLYLAGGIRYALDGRIGVHRPYFENKYFGQLPLKKAEAEYKKMEREFHDFVISQGLPRSIYERLLATPSTEIYWLTESDLALIGSSPPYLEEKFISACGAAQGNLRDIKGYGKCLQEVLSSQTVEGITNLGGKRNNK